jgi:integrase
MARKVKDRELDTRAAREKLKPRGKPYWRLIERGLHLGYRRLKGKAGTWCLRHYLGEQAYGVEAIGAADDLSDADGMVILDYWQAVEKARQRMVERASEANGTGDVLTVRTAIDAYITMRDAREGRRQGRAVRSDAHRLALYVIGREQRGNRAAIKPTKLADVPLPALTETDLSNWRNQLPDMTEASKRRTISDLKAALNAAYEKNRKRLDATLPATIRHALKAQQHDDDDEAEPLARENQILADAEVTKLLRAAREIDAEKEWDGDLYRMVLVLAATGARFSQVRRLKVGDFQREKKRIMMPPSRKGKGKKKNFESLPVGPDVLDALQSVVTGRPKNAPLLEHWRRQPTAGGNGGPQWERAERGAWQSPSELKRAWRAIRERAKMPETIPYALRHSSIVRGIKANLPLRLVAALHDTSVVMIERHYSKWITHGLEELAAKAVVPLAPSEKDGKVLPLRRG